jgi:2-polyprenyl-6-methoxyphenol hydroxylase-like FAD-dependent oxidoreductase
MSTPHPPLKILISGSGIAASVFASWLLRAYPASSIAITIVERTPTLRLTGASVDIRSSAVPIIKAMRVESEIRSHTTKEEGVMFVRDDGSVVGTLGATGRDDIQSFTSEFEIFRGRLAEIFIAPIRDKVNIVFDETIESFVQLPDEGGVAVTFAKSRKTETYDLLVAADGVYSRIRGSMLSSSPVEQIHDEGVHVAYFTIKKDLLKGSKLAQWYNAPGGRVILLRPDPDPRGRTRAHFMVVTTSSQESLEVRKRLNQAMKEGNESYMRLIEEMFADAGWRAGEVIEGMRECDDFYCNLFAQVRSPVLQDGRVVLLGDAGYATPGIGTSLAIIGGYVLAGELLRAGLGDVKTAVKRYEELMLPFVKSQQGGGVDSGMQWTNPQTWWGIWIRNLILAFVTWIRLDRLMVWFASRLGFTEKMLAMPEYEWPQNMGH